MFSRIFVYRYHGNIDISQNVNHAKVQSKTNKYRKFHFDLTRRRLSKSRFKKLGMVPKKLYRNTLTGNKSEQTIFTLPTNNRLSRKRLTALALLTVLSTGSKFLSNNLLCYLHLFRLAKCGYCGFSLLILAIILSRYNNHQT